MWNNTKVLQPILEKNYKRKCQGSEGNVSNWRYSNYKKLGDSLQLHPGIATLSPGWFAQGHDVIN
jgi:hypothetical protein